jgi:hypothetical protein
MFVNNRSAVGVTAAADENASIMIAAARARTKTPSRLKTPKRRAFGDISNRKPGTTVTTTKKTPSVHVTTKNKKKESSKIVPPASSSINRRQVSFALPSTKNAVNEKRATTTTTLHVELSAGRTWSEQQDHHHCEDDDDDDDDIADILAEQEAWETEVTAFCQEEQTRHLNIRKVQQQAHEQEYQEKLEALWKQDDDGMYIMLYCYYIMCCRVKQTTKSHSSVLFIHSFILSMRIDLAVAGLLDNLILESVPSFDDLSLGEDSLGPLEHDISF